MIVNLLCTDRPQPKRKRGRDRRTNRDRDIWIVGAVERIANRGFAPTRNRVTQKDSACAIVAIALGQLGIKLTEATVEKIWEDRQL